jgi:hypothetical protein
MSRANARSEFYYSIGVMLFGLTLSNWAPGCRTDTARVMSEDNSRTRRRALEPSSPPIAQTPLMSMSIERQRDLIARGGFLGQRLMSYRAAHHVRGRRSAGDERLSPDFCPCFSLCGLRLCAS